MELFKLLGKIAIDNSEANSELAETSTKAKETAKDIGKSNQSTQSSNEKTGSSFSSLKSKVNEYKAQGMSTSQAWRKANQDMKSSTEGAGDGMVSAFKKVGAAVATFLTTTAIVAFGKSCIQAAADAQAMESQFSQVFGDLEGKASKSLSGIADEAGISENRMKGSFTKIAAFAKTTGMDTEDALSLSERAMVAVADSAAFYDRSLEETTESLQSFLKGNYENDAALGLSATETTRNAAANKLYGKSFNDLSESQKQLTLLQMVEDANKASGALGQAARESDTWTNVLGNLKQGWTDFQAVLGSYILPTAVQAVKSMAGALEGLTEKTKDAIEWCKDHSAELKGVAVFIGAAATAVGIYSSGLTFAAVKTTIMTAATSAFAGVMGFLTSPVTLVILAIGALAAAFVTAYNKSETFRNFINKLKDGLVNGFNTMKEAASQLKGKLSEAWDSIVQKCQPVIDAIQKNLVGAFNDLKKAGQGVKDAIGELKEKFQPVADLLSGAFSTAASGASGWFDKLTAKAGDLAKGALEWLKEKITVARDGFQKVAEFAGKLWDNLDPVVTLIRDNLLNALKNLEEPINTIKEAFGVIGDTIMNHLLPALRDALMPVWESLKSALSGVAGILGGAFVAAFVAAFGLAVGAINGIVSAISGFAEAFSGIIQIVSNIFKLIVGVFTLNGDLCKEALQGIWDGVVKVFGGLWDAVSGFLQGFIDGVVGFFKGLWDTLVGHSIVPDTIDGIVDCFAGLWDKVKGLVSKFKEGVVNAFNNMKDKAISAYNTLKDKVSNAATSVKNKVSNAWEGLKSKTSSAFSSAKDKASSAWDSLKNKVSSSASATKDKASSAWESLKSKTSSAFSSAKEKASSAFSSLKSKVTSYASSTASSAGEKFNSLKSKVSSAVEGAKSKASSAFSTIKSKISSSVSGAFSAVSSKFGAIKDKITSVMNSAKSIVSGAVSKLKSAFNFSWSLPKLKLPHISVKGGKAPYGIGGAGHLPSFSIKWYRDAMNTPKILTKPTVWAFDSVTGKARGAGDGAGSELVGGTTTVMRMIESAVSSQNAEFVYYLQKIIDVLCDYFPQVLDALMNMNLVLDDGTLVGRLAPAMDVELGKIKVKKERGR